MKQRAGPKEEKPRKWYDYWPFLIALMEIVLNVDWVVIPILVKRGVFLNILFLHINWDMSGTIPELSSFGILGIVCSISIVTCFGWYWFWGWLGKFIIQTARKREAIKEAIALGMKIELDLERRGYIDLVKNWFVHTFDWATGEDNRYLKYLRRGGYSALLIVSALPVSGARIVATIFSRSLERRKALAILAAGDSIKNAIMVLGFWNLIFWIFSRL